MGSLFSKKAKPNPLAAYYQGNELRYEVGAIRKVPGMQWVVCNVMTKPRPHLQFTYWIDEVPSTVTNPRESILHYLRTFHPHATNDDFELHPIDPSTCTIELH
jgi:hypothetical protein